MPVFIGFMVVLLGGTQDRGTPEPVEAGVSRARGPHQFSVQPGPGAMRDH
jgi:hypothetical protein